jgi:drug/metabolite transporter (DMT)-like permease
VIWGVLAATAGLALLSGMGEGGARLSRGDALMLGCAAAFAFQIVAVSRHAGHAAGALLWTELASVAVLAWPAALLLETPRLALTPSTVMAVAILVVPATLGALWAQNHAQARTGPTRAALLLTLEPVFAALTAWAVAGETLRPTELAGCVLILGGMVLAELPGARRAEDAHGIVSRS